MDWKTSESLLTGHAQAKPRGCVRDAEGSVLCVGGWIQHKKVPFNEKFLLFYCPETQIHIGKLD